MCPQVLICFGNDKWVVSEVRSSTRPTHGCATAHREEPSSGSAVSFSAAPLVPSLRCSSPLVDWTAAIATALLPEGSKQREVWARLRKMSSPMQKKSTEKSGEESNFAKPDMSWNLDHGKPGGKHWDVDIHRKMIHWDNPETYKKENQLFSGKNSGSLWWMLIKMGVMIRGKKGNHVVLGSRRLGFRNRSFRIDENNGPLCDTTIPRTKHLWRRGNAKKTNQTANLQTGSKCIIKNHIHCRKMQTDRDILRKIIGVASHRKKIKKKRGANNDGQKWKTSWKKGSPLKK